MLILWEMCDRFMEGGFGPLSSYPEGVPKRPMLNKIDRTTKNKIQKKQAKDSLSTYIFYHKLITAILQFS